MTDRGETSCVRPAGVFVCAASGGCRPHSFLCSILLMTLVLLSGCKPKTRPASGPQTAFHGVKLRVLVVDNPAIANWINDQRGEWSAQTGAEVEIANIAAAEFFGERGGSGDQSSSDLPGDVLICHSTALGSLLERGLAQELPKAVLGSAALDRADIPVVVADHVVGWQRALYAVPVSAACQLVWFRKDLLENETNRERFEQKYGHALQPPGTWVEFDEIAEFFAESDLDGDGEPDRSVVIDNPADALVARAAARGKHPHNFSFYFDVNSLEPLVSNEPFAEALSEWVRLAPMTADNAGRALEVFRSGQAVLAVGSSAHASRMFQLDPARERTSVSRKVGCVPLPGSLRVFDHGKRSWADLPRDRPNRAAVVDGFVASVPKSSRHAEAAFNLLQFLTSRERSLISVTSPGFRLGPYRSSHLADPAAWIAAGWSASETAAYLSAMRQSLNDPNAVGQLRIDGAAEYHESLDRAVRAALRGEKSPSDALADAAATWRAITERLGIERQRRQYRHSLGMPVLD